MVLYGWSNTLPALLCVALGLPVPFLLWRYGERLRRRVCFGVLIGLVLVDIRKVMELETNDLRLRKSLQCRNCNHCSNMM
jgi:hypothetical protein